MLMRKLSVFHAHMAATCSYTRWTRIDFSLPTHRWLSPADTHFEEAVFVKHREGVGAQKRQLARNAAARESAKGGCHTYGTLPRM